MKFVSSPLHFQTSGHSVTISRDIKYRIAMMDNLVELVAFTPRGSFNADPDFGLEFWNHEYSNVKEDQFNNKDTGKDKFHKKSTKERCEASFAESIITYAPESLKVKDIHVEMNLKDTDTTHHGHHRVYSHHEVEIIVSAQFDNGLGTTFDYNRKVSFMVEPTARKRRI